MVSLSESFRRLCYIGSYQADRDNRLNPTEKSGVDCTNEWYLGGVFVYIYWQPFSPVFAGIVSN